MTENSKKWLRITYYTLITTALVAVAALLMAACVAIYRSGPAPFTPETVAARFDRIALPVYLCLRLVMAGFILHPLLPDASETDQGRDRMTVQRLQSRTDLALCPADLAAAIKKEQNTRRCHRRIALLLLLAGAAVVAWYALSFDRFSKEDINGSMARSMLVFGPCLALPGAYGVFSLFHNRRSYRREIQLYRQVPVEAKCAPPDSREEAWVAPLKNAILMVAVGLIVAGFAAGGWVDVLTKAINICTECVGLG